MRVFGKFKRAQLREKPQRKIGPFCNPVRRLVRLKEKERLFCEMGSPRIIPRPKSAAKEKILEAIKAPNVSKEVLERRLEFLLSNESVYQQMYNKMYNGITPYQCELYMWERQMRDLRKIYRAQYLHKLSEVTNEERYNQLKLVSQTREDKRKRREEIRKRILEEKKRRAILKDRLELEKKITQSILFKRQSTRKKQNIYWLTKLQKKSVFDENSTYGKNEGKEKMEKNEEALFSRNLSVSDLYRQIGYEVREENNKSGRIFKVDKFYRQLLEDSFDFLEEDADQFEENEQEKEDNSKGGVEVTHRQRAHILYSSFSDEEKLKLLNDKIAILTKKIEDQSVAKGLENNNLMFYIQLKDKLEASKQAFLESNYLRKNDNKK